MTTPTDPVPDQPVFTTFIQPFLNADILYCSLRHCSHFSYSNKCMPTRLMGAMYRQPDELPREHSIPARAEVRSYWLSSLSPKCNLSLSAKEQITADIWEHPGENRGCRGKRGKSLSNIAFLAFNQTQLHSIHRRLSQVNTNKIFSEANFPESFPKLCLRSSAGDSRTLHPRINGGLLQAPPWAVWTLRHRALFRSRSHRG